MSKESKSVHSSAISKLRSDKWQQVVRLVNPHNIQIEFHVEVCKIEKGSEEDDQALRVSPERGIIEPRDYVNIVVNNNHYNSTSLLSPSRLINIHYSIGNVNNGLRQTTQNVVSIGFDSANHQQQLKVTESITWTLSRILKSALVAALIIYNIILIKVSL